MPNFTVHYAALFVYCCNIFLRRYIVIVEVELPPSWLVMTGANLGGALKQPRGLEVGGKRRKNQIFSLLLPHATQLDQSRPYFWRSPQVALASTNQDRSIETYDLDKSDNHTSCKQSSSGERGGEWERLGGQIDATYDIFGARVIILHCRSCPGCNT